MEAENRGQRRREIEPCLSRTNRDERCADDRQPRPRQRFARAVGRAARGEAIRERRARSTLRPCRAARSHERTRGARGRRPPRIRRPSPLPARRRARAGALSPPPRRLQSPQCLEPPTQARRTWSMSGLLVGAVATPAPGEAVPASTPRTTSARSVVVVRPGRWRATLRSAARRAGRHPPQHARCRRRSGREAAPPSTSESQRAVRPQRSD